jgi:hypothetical protein
MHRLLALGVAAIAVALGCPRPAAADGAASTRNIIFGAAAAGAGTLLIINHNKKVHEKDAAYDRHQAETQARADQSQAAYDSERQAYAHEAALVSEYAKEVSYQHAVVHAQAEQIATLRRSLAVAKSSGPRAHSGSPADPARGLVSYGWGSY